MFSCVVALYRAMGAPAIEGNVVSYHGSPTPDINASLEACKGLQPAFGKIQHNEIDECGVLELELRLPSNELGRFYITVEDLARSGSLSKGQFPKNIYIVELDWADFESGIPIAIKKLKRVCRLVELLTLLAVGVDKESSPYTYNLFFALPPDGPKPPKTFLLATQVNEHVLEHELRHLSLLEEILNQKNENKAHLSERKLMIRMAIASVIEKFENEPNHFLVLVREWSEVIAIYRANLQTYVYNFSFEKARRELAQAEIDYGTKLSGVLGDIAGKMLALPVSFAGWLVLHKSDSAFESFVVVLGLIVVSLVLLSILHNQILQTKRLLHSFNVVFDDFKSKIKTYPPKLQSLLRTTIQQVETQGQTIRRTFLLLQTLAFFPAAGAMLLALIKYWDPLMLILISSVSAISATWTSTPFL
ncbi:hypothetical protein PsyrH_20185 [Pseudomonas syringae pv. syringae HS191]|uniref:hypothetical protein n=1 Tax=Pseudomonas syringae TaxID=317 RepID=UPI000624B7F6|nr:hypothetical protein [Pseudomonas syringae]AKF52770.1 hypothetical protein PsyrH_20185 [Pseudomonas syringae pv. syringae HS191]RML71579.1 hypothetical protein ALQ91_00303 [Pseudomonas syringae pv. syringae]